MNLKIRHVTEYRYEPAASRVAFRLRLFPTENALQSPTSWAVTVNGEPPWPATVNAYGDREAIWLSHDPMDRIEIVAEGVVETRDAAGVISDWRMAARPEMFLRRTALTTPDDTVRALADKVADEADGLTRAHALSAMVQERIAYEPGATTSVTTAAEALRGGAGVCQDQTHVLVTAARVLGAPARYVSGYLHTGGDEELIGETAESHAWAEIWIPSLGWVGFDATNQVCPTDRYVRLASGLDAADAAPVRGAVTGTVEETLTAEVAVSAVQQ